MKKIVILVASLVIFAGLTYANPLIQQKSSTEKKDEKKDDKKAVKTDKKEVKKVPVRKTQDKKTTK